MARTSPTRHLVAVGEDDFPQAVLAASHERPVVVDFWATWCRPCTMMTPVLDELAGAAGQRLRIVTVNLDDEPELGAECRVTSLPTILVFRDGAEVRRLHGAQSKSALRSAFEELV